MWTRSVPVGEIRLLGDCGLVIGVEDAAAARRLVAALSEGGALPGVTPREVVGGLATVLVILAPDGEDPGAVTERLGELVASVARSGGAAGNDTNRESRPVVSIPTIFDGPDLAEVAALTRCSPSSVIERLTASVLTVEVVGFSPGFAYLAGLPEELAAVPRRASPRPVVPAGSVAVAGGYAAVYPGPSPGGWQLLGRTREPLFSSREPPYARLAPGDRVQFTVSSETDVVPPPTAAVTGTGSHPESTDPTFVVEEAGLRTVLQDAGRRGMAAIGVPGAGPADPYSFEVANRLVGNDPDAGALEITARGPTLRCLRPAYVAVVGPRLDVRVAGQAVPSGQVLPLTEGQRLSIGAVRGGLRAYLAVAGGFDGPQVLGSRSSDELAGLGPGPLAAGDLLGTGTLRPPLGDHVRPDAADELAPGQPVVLRVVPGPHHERFAPDDYATLADRHFRVGAESNRVGLRLEQVDGPSPLRPAHGTGELDSQGTITGTVQVPPSGDPVILLPDHATLGGYPVLAVVASADHGLLGQCTPGASVVLVPVDHRAARNALAERRRAVARAVSGRYPLAVE